MELPRLENVVTLQQFVTHLLTVSATLDGASDPPASSGARSPLGELLIVFGHEAGFGSLENSFDMIKQVMPLVQLGRADSAICRLLEAWLADPDVCRVLDTDADTDRFLFGCEQLLSSINAARTTENLFSVFVLLLGEGNDGHSRLSPVRTVRMNAAASAASISTCAAMRGTM